MGGWSFLVFEWWSCLGVVFGFGLGCEVVSVILKCEGLRQGNWDGWELCDYWVMRRFSWFFVFGCVFGDWEVLNDFCEHWAYLND